MSDRQYFVAAIVFFLLSCFLIRSCAADTWGNPFAWENNQLTLQNNSMDWNNNPYNWDNTFLNPYAKNGLYDNDGNRIGYERKNEYGTTNIFDNDGNRRAYNPR